MPDEKTLTRIANPTADDLAKEFREHSVAEFFKKNKQMLGLSGKTKALTTIIHEYITNSLDACENANILPEIEVHIKELEAEHYEVTVADNGPGLTRETVGKAFGQLLAGTKFHRLMQMRGQQGIGASGATMLSQMTTGKEIHVITGNDKEVISCDLSIDAKYNQPKVHNIKILTRKFRGTIVKAEFKEMKYVNNEQGPLEYVRRTAIANPHAKLTFTDPSGQTIAFERTAKTIPDKPEEVKPHPRGVTVDELLNLAKYTQARRTNSFLKIELDRMGDTAVKEVGEKVSFDLNKDPHALSWREIEEMVKAFKDITFIAPRTDALRPIGEEQIKRSLQTIVEPEFLSVVTRKPQVSEGGYPFQVEVSVCYGGKAGRRVGDEMRIEIMRFANRAPLLFDTGGCGITEAVKTVEWKRYGIRDSETAPLTVFVNLISVHIPYTGAGKQAISNDEEIVEEIRLALMESGRKTARYIISKEHERLKQEKKRIYMKYAIEVAIGLGELIEKDPKPIEHKLLETVAKRLKLDEQQEKKMEAQTDEDLEKELERLNKEDKKKGKAKKPAENEEGGEE
ncbi:MAG: DNA topoisomerase VI subunit B [Candidatus Diapherotrites archaeon]|nr:DNA topoisomerase VI subunit B [Candidatus Diapherotrites archaeon]MDZ4256758.1 DNA topoisomerase VI subunit B [archaeon]